MTPEDIEALRRLASSDQAGAFFRDFLEVRDQQLRESTPELDAAEAAGLSASATDERNTIMESWDLDGDESRTHLVVAIEDSNPEAMIEHARELFVTGWMAALREHGLLPSEPSYEERTGEPFPTIEGP